MSPAVAVQDPIVKYLDLLMDAVCVVDADEVRYTESDQELLQFVSD